MRTSENRLYHLYELKREIDELKREIGWWRRALDELKNALISMIDFSKNACNQGNHVQRAAAEMLLPKLELLQEKIDTPQLDRFIEDEFKEAVESVRSVLKEEKGQNVPGSFYNTLHHFKNQVLAVYSHSKEIERIVHRCLSDLKEASSDEEMKSLMQDLESVIRTIRNGISQESISKIESVFDRLESKIPPGPSLKQRREERRIESYRERIERVFIIEDQEIWSEPLKEVIVEEFPYLENNTYCWRTYKQAVKGLESLGKTSREQREQLLVILDFGLPEDENDLSCGKVSRNLGKKLLQRLSSYALNIRTVILTTHSDFVDDLRWALNNGIEPEDYILKGEEYKERIRSSIKRIIQSERRVSEIKVLERDDGDGLVIIDDVNVQLEPVYFRTFRVLCNYRYPKSAKEILEDRNESYGSYETYDATQTQVISDHIYKIREKIHEAFKRVGKSVSPHLIIETVPSEEDEEEKYRIGEGIKRKIERLEEGSSGPSEVSYSSVYSPSVSVLIVENDPHWCEVIKEFLEELGYETEIAHSVEGAIGAIEKNPALVCLDMHLPENEDEWNVNPTGGTTEGGFKALTGIRKKLDDVGVVVLTDHYEKEDLIKRAIREGIDINHWVAKDENWKSNLAYAVWRLTREYKLGIKTPVEDEISSRPRIRLTRSNERAIFIDDVEIELSENRSKLVWALAEKGRLSRREILEKIYGDDENKWPRNEQSALNSLVEDTRKAIGKALRDAGKELDPKKIVVETCDGYELKGLIFITD